MQNKSRLLTKLGIATAVALGGLTLASQPAAFAAAPGFSVSPATGLTDGATATVTVTGAAAGTEFSIVQCATVNDQLACNGDTVKTVTTDAAGSADTAFVVRKTFQGATPTGASVGTVDCAATTCFVSVGNETAFLGSQALTFR
ncbi:enediyne antibiotic chromoprotein [Planobispora takensis]|uniref:Neocarzinostatin n=1 Tax=Planobispora takensis TaxID=1367882 RepID=A0A8J3SRI4_9ACTN|nr:enediyne antibiotic chromoprotein [Planobispora takensis]GIH99278.1 hypothetical protein Pta02_12870 [Planobispora takensis]